MSEKAIEIRNLSKCYRIGLREETARTLVESLAGYIRQPLRNLRRLRRLSRFDRNGDESDVIWALRNLSLDVDRGEVVGIIGGNGAGKSTLLKILSRIVTPSKGHGVIRGRVGSLLEVGTGFHPELTGRENIYLNGIILGMRKREIDRKFEAIVEFSGVEKFLDTPIKRYSTGMAVRLAFSVAAHLEPEILLIDEVLAVGDAAFQVKCIGKMSEVAGQGRTVLFVSHQIAAVTKLCQRAIWLDDGSIRMEGPAEDVAQFYLMEGTENRATWENPHPAAAPAEVVIRSVHLLSSPERIPLHVISYSQPFEIEIRYDVLEHVSNLAVLCRLTNVLGSVVWTSWDSDTTDWGRRTRSPGSYVSVCRVPPCSLRPGRLLLTVGALIDRRKGCDFHENILVFDISVVGFPLNPERQGIVAPLLEWKVRKLQ